MEKCTLNIRFIYKINNLVFNVGDNGSKMHYDPQFNRSYGFASADNIKHCIKDKFSDITDITIPQRTYIKNIKNGDKDKQGELYTDFNLENPITRLFGIWNPTDLKTSYSKYNKCSITSMMRISEMLPIHPLLVTTNKECGVNVGNLNDKVCFKDKDTYYYSIEDLSKIKSLDDAQKLIQETRPMNFFEKNITSSGIYYYDIHIDLHHLRYTDISGVTLTDETINEYKNKGYDIILDNKKGKKYFVVPLNEALQSFYDLIDALFNWQFLSNNTTHGSMPELLRITPSIDNTHLWQNANGAKLNPDGKTASLDFYSIEDEQKTNVFSFNTKALKQVYYNENFNYDIFAAKLANENIKKLGENVIKNITL